MVRLRVSGLQQNAFHAAIRGELRDMTRFHQRKTQKCTNTNVMINDSNAQKIYMKHIFLIISAAFIIAGCTQKKTDVAAPQKNIVVSILPQKTFVEKIAGNDFNVVVLLPPGTSPAAFSLLPSQMADIENASTWFRIGYIGFELSWKDKICETNKLMKVVDLSEGLNLISAGSTTENGKVILQGVDPHVWLSPTLVKQMATKIMSELIDVNPSKSEKYKANYTNFIAGIDSLDAEIKNKIAPFAGRKIISFHPSLSYFAREYGLEQLSLEPGGKEPAPQRLKELIDIAKRENIKVIYIQSELDRELARVFAEETGGQIVQVRPLNPDWTGNLAELAQTIVNNF